MTKIHKDKKEAIELDLSDSGRRIAISTKLTNDFKIVEYMGIHNTPHLQMQHWPQMGYSQSSIHRRDNLIGLRLDRRLGDSIKVPGDDSHETFQQREATHVERYLQSQHTKTWNYDRGHWRDLNLPQPGQQFYL